MFNRILRCNHQRKNSLRRIFMIFHGNFDTFIEVNNMHMNFLLCMNQIVMKPRFSATIYEFIVYIWPFAAIGVFFLMHFSIRSILYLSLYCIFTCRSTKEAPFDNWLECFCQYQKAISWWFSSLYKVITSISDMKKYVHMCVSNGKHGFCDLLTGMKNLSFS
jgi:hypothetical protein